MNKVETLISIVSFVILFLFGVLIGNFTTTIFHRLPRKIGIGGFDSELSSPPFCSNCNHLLRFYEYLPILSWFSTFGKCNYCHLPITKSYIILEISIGLIAIILYYLSGQNLQYFFLYFCFASLALLNISIYLKHNFVPLETTLGVIILGTIYRTLIDQEIFLWLMSLSVAGVLGLSLIKKRLITNNVLIVHLILPASLWCRSYSEILFFFISIVLGYLISRLINDKLFYPLCLINLFIISFVNPL